MGSAFKKEPHMKNNMYGGTIQKELYMQGEPYMRNHSRRGNHT